MKVGILGGTFDPVHFGHLITARAVLELRNLDKIIFVPCRVSPFKTGKITQPATHRYEMLRLALQDNPKFELSDYEVMQDKVSYTVETLKHFKSLYTNLELIIGFDNLLDFHLWQGPDEMIKIAKLVVMRRQGSFEQERPKNDFVKHACFVDTPLVEISATLIRHRVKKGKSIDYLLPLPVKEYIEKNNLYL